MIDNVQKAEATLTCNRCGHVVPPPTKPMTDDMLIVCPACGANLGRWGDVKNKIASAVTNAAVGEMFRGTQSKPE
jgi:DNA-directed RNA polymerase subunit RPC12/RpoP